MSQMIERGKELIRINPKEKTRLEYSTCNGRSWNTRYMGGYCGEFIDLIDNGTELLAMTSKGTYYSRSDGKSWNKKS